MPAIRQVVDWSHDAAANEAWSGKPVVLGTTQNRLPPEERGDAFSADALRMAEREGVALLTSLQLMHALSEHQHGRLDLTGFWDAIHGAAGVVDVANA